jgi:XisH protein
LAARRGSEKIVVEIKSFLSPSPMRDFEMALGQYILYRNLIALTEPEYRLYLAIIETVYVKILSREAIKEVVALNQLNLIIVDLEKEEIILWIK